MTTKQIEELALRVVADHYGYRGIVNISPDCVEAIIARKAIAATLTERSQTEEGAREVQQSAKPGWAMVPREPTEAMIKAWFDAPRAKGAVGPERFAAAWSAMLSASPEGEG
jgi:hypothetical protein